MGAGLVLRAAGASWGRWPEGRGGQRQPLVLRRGYGPCPAARAPPQSWDCVTGREHCGATALRSWYHRAQQGCATCSAVCGPRACRARAGDAVGKVGGKKRAAPGAGGWCRRTVQGQAGGGWGVTGSGSGSGSVFGLHVRCNRCAETKGIWRCPSISRSESRSESRSRSRSRSRSTSGSSGEDVVHIVQPVPQGVPDPVGPDGSFPHTHWERSP
jgi:hypothetical protein